MAARPASHLPPFEGYPVTSTDRPDWADGRELCPFCSTWQLVTQQGRLRQHKRQDPARWRMVPCNGSGTLVAADQPTTP